MAGIAELRSSAFFHSALATSSPDEISEMIDVLAKNRRILEHDVTSLVFYMNGGLDYNDAWLLTQEQRKSMSKIIEKHFEAMNPKKSNQL